ERQFIDHHQAPLLLYLMQVPDYQSQKAPVLAGYSFSAKDLEAALKDNQALKQACSWMPQMAYIATLTNLVVGTPPYQLFVTAPSEQAAKDYKNRNYILSPVGISHKLGATEDPLAKQMKEVIMTKKPPVTPKWVVLKDQYVVSTIVG
ncbi:unnamed protein product, partial [Rhizoctonia solani]